MKCETCGGDDREPSDDLSHVLCRVEELESKLDEYRKADEAGLEREVASLERIKELESRLDSAEQAVRLQKVAYRMAEERANTAEGRLDEAEKELEIWRRTRYDTDLSSWASECALETRAHNLARTKIKELESHLDSIMKAIRHCAGESSFDSCNYRADSKPYCTECGRHDYEGHEELCWRRLAFEEPVVERHEHIVGQINPTESGDVIIEFERTSRPGVELSICALCSKQFSPE